MSASKINDRSNAFIDVGIRNKSLTYSLNIPCILSNLRKSYNIAIYFRHLSLFKQIYILVLTCARSCIVAPSKLTSIINEERPWA